MTSEISFLAAFGEVDYEVKISRVSGNGGSLHIYLNNYFIGDVGETIFGIRVYWTSPTAKSMHKEELLCLGRDDADAIIERLEQGEMI